MCYFNKKLKAPGQTIEYTEHQLSEYIKCRNSLEYFAETYCSIVTIDGGLTKLELWDFQRDILRSFQSDQFVCINASRQVGKSMIYAIFCCWYVIFHDYKKIAILANKMATVKSILNEKIKICYENLPYWIQQSVTVYNISSFELENHSIIAVYPTSPSSIRGLTCSVLICDEVAIINTKLWEEFSRSSFPVISSGRTSKIFLFSTPKGLHTPWYNIVKDAKLKKNKFKLS